MPLSITAYAGAQTVKMAGFGYTTDWSNRTVNLAAGIVAADVGKALTIDPSAPNTFKLATDGAPIHGRLEVVESRTNEGTLIGTAKLILAGVKMPVKAADPLAAGDYCIGGGLGTVKAATTVAAAAARVTTLSGTSGATWTARDAGSAGNGISITVAASDTTGTVTVNGNDIVVVPATAANTTTAVIAQIAANAEANALISGVATGSGAGAPQVAVTSLASGTDSVPVAGVKHYVTDVTGGYATVYQ